MELLISQTIQLYNITQLCKLLRTLHKGKKTSTNILTTAIGHFWKQHLIFMRFYASKCILHQGFKNLPKIQEPPQNSGPP